MGAVQQSLAMCREVEANGGYVPAREVDAFAGRTRYASDLIRAAGIRPDCDIHAGTRIGGGTPTDCQAPLNAFLATAAVNNPVRLIVDCGFALSRTLSTFGRTTISTVGGGPEWDCGMFMMAGSRAGPISYGLGATDHDHAVALGVPGLTGSNLTLRGFYANCNRGTFPNGCMDNSNGDGTLTPPLGNNARGLDNYYWITAITVVGCENLICEDLWLWDPCTYCINPYACEKVWVRRCRLEAPAADPGTNFAGVQTQGDCRRVWISDCWMKGGDDPIAINCDEGDAAAGMDVDIHGNWTQSVSGVRIYGKNVATSRVRISHHTMTGLETYGILIGNNNNATSAVADCNHDVAIRDVTAIWRGNAQYGSLTFDGNAGVVTVDNLRTIDPTYSAPLIYLQGGSTVSSLEVRRSGNHRSSYGSAASPALVATGACKVGRLDLDLRYTEQYGMTAPADLATPLIDLTGMTVGQLTLSGNLAGVGNAISAPAGSSVGLIHIPDLKHVSHGGGAHTIVNNGGTIHAHVGTVLGTGVAGIASGTGTTTVTPAAAAVTPI